MRGVSIVLVILTHLSIRIPLDHTALAWFLPRPLLIGLGTDGYEAVFVFFVVSGFLITGNALERWGSLARPDWRAFYRRRAARILPCLLVLVAILSVLDLLHRPHFTIDGPGQSLSGAIQSALLMHLNWYEGQTGYLPPGWDVLWSLSIEEAFYLCFPPLCFLLGRSRVPALLLFGALAMSLPLIRDALAHAPEIWREKHYGRCSRRTARRPQDLRVKDGRRTIGRRLVGRGRSSSAMRRANTAQAWW